MTEQTVLNVGSGPKEKSLLPDVFMTGEWKQIRLDVDPDHEPDILGDATNMEAVERDSVDALYSSHTLEHLFPDQVPPTLREFFRVIKPGGFALILVPDLMTAAEQVLEDNLDVDLFKPEGEAIVTPLDLLYGHRATFHEPKMTSLHKTGYTPRTLALLLSAAGFEGGQTWRDPRAAALWAWAEKPAG